MIFILLVVYTAMVLQSCKREASTLPRSTAERSVVEHFFETGLYHHHVNNNIDSALIYYDKVINSMINKIKPSEIKYYEEILIRAYRWSAQIHFNTGDYRTAHEMLLRALQLSGIWDDTYISQIYMSLGNIYMRINEYDLAKSYYLEALKHAGTTTHKLSILGHLAYLEIRTGNFDEALTVLNQSLHVTQHYNIPVPPRISFGFAEYYRARGIHDSAYLYYKRALDKIEQGEVTQGTLALAARVLSNFGDFFFENKELDSATHYITLSNKIAAERSFLRTLSANYLILSKIAESRGEKLTASEYFRKHSDINDAIFSRRIIADINQMRRVTIDYKIDQLMFEQYIKKQQIRHRSNFLYLALSVLILTSLGLLFLFFQNKRLNLANRLLVDKNRRIIELQTDQTQSKEKAKKALSDDIQMELLERIFTVMKDESVVYDPELTIEKFADLVQSNRTYVSQVINGALKKNFREFLNEYRIMEAQRLISEVDFSKYTFEFIVHKTGFKSRSTFNAAFKEITGVTPKFYLESVQKQK